MDFFKKLEKKGFIYNESQKEAIKHVNGPLLVIAGPGSGKTSVITSRAAYLIQKAGINPSNILVITFTRAAANEMKLRFTDFPGVTGEHLKKIDFGTFHSTFYRIVNFHYGRHIPVLEQNKVYGILKDILRSINEPFDEETVQNLLNDISLARTTVENPGDYKSQYLSTAKFMTVFNKYEKNKRALKCIDFDDMMVLCKDILQSDTKTLSYYRQKYKYVLIDEFQDTNKMQFEIVKLLSNPDNNICAVGDDDQSIYGFRGALPQCLTNFEHDFIPCKTVLLDINYRSTREIVDISKTIIANSSNRKDKDLKSHGSSGSNPEILFPPDEKLEAASVMDSIEDLRNQGYSYKDFAVLYRTNMQANHIIDELITRSIPFNVKDSLSNFFEHWVCRDLTCYLRLSIDNNDTKHLSQIVNRPVRYITRESMNKAISEVSSGVCDAHQFFERSNLKEFQKQRIRDLYRDLKTLKYLSPSSAISFIRKSIGYDEYIRNYCMESDIDHDELYGVLNEYELSSSGFNTIIDFLAHIREVSVKLKGTRTKASYKKDSITLSTIHSAKGLEFPCVFIIGVIEGFLPHLKSLKTGENIDEERRLLYVAATRAKEMLFITVPKKHHGKNTEISRFIQAITDEKGLSKSRKSFSQDLNTGQLVSHKLFGTGTVISISYGIAEIRFNNKYGTKPLDIKTCMENNLIEML